VIERIEREALRNLSETGTLYLLFDPVPSEDLSLDKSFTFVGFRKKVLPDYKSGRTYSSTYAAAMRTLRKYYAYRGPRIIEVYSDEYEADDYIISLIENLKKEWNLKYPNGGTECKIALWSTDQDWSSRITN
jgi:glycerophosphoryl diester phosphodiesterase